jgi:hypothetical protein
MILVAAIEMLFPHILALVRTLGVHATASLGCDATITCWYAKKMLGSHAQQQLNVMQAIHFAPTLLAPLYVEAPLGLVNLKESVEDQATFAFLATVKVDCVPQEVAVVGRNFSVP